MDESDQTVEQRTGMDDTRVSIVIEVQDDKTTIAIHGMNRAEAIGTLSVAQHILMCEQAFDADAPTA